MSDYFIPALSRQMFPVLIKLLWVSALLGESLVRGERLSSYRPQMGYKQNVELRAATTSMWIILVLTQSHWSLLKKKKVSWRFLAAQRRIYLLRTLFVDGAAIFHHSFIRNKTFHSGHSYIPETQRGANLTRVQIDAVNKMRARGKHDYDPGDSVLAVNFTANHRCFDICMCHITVHVFI